MVLTELTGIGLFGVVVSYLDASRTIVRFIGKTRLVCGGEFIRLDNRLHVDEFLFERKCHESTDYLARGNRSGGA